MAAFVHGLSLAALSSLSRSGSGADAPSTNDALQKEPADELEVSLAPLDAPEAEPARVAATAPTPPAPRHVVSPAEPRATSADAAPQVAELSSDVNATDSVEAASDVAAEPSPSQPIDLGVGAEGWRRWAVNAPSQAGPAPSERKRQPRFKAPAKSQTGGLLEGLEEHDRSLGLSPSGRVRTALFNAAHSDIAPELGVASFHVTLHNDGAVEISVHGASDNEHKWQEVASRAAAELRKNPPRIPPPRSGARMLVEIKAEAVMPNGAKVADLHGTRVELLPPRLRSVDESRRALKERNPTADAPFEPGRTMPLIQLDPPGLYLSHVGKVCSVRAGITPLGLGLSGGCDPANIGSKPARLVHTRVREESLF